MQGPRTGDAVANPRCVALRAARSGPGTTEREAARGIRDDGARWRARRPGVFSKAGVRHRVLAPDDVTVAKAPDRAFVRSRTRLSLLAEIVILASGGRQDQRCDRHRDELSHRRTMRSIRVAGIRRVARGVARVGVTRHVGRAAPAAIRASARARCRKRVQAACKIARAGRRRCARRVGDHGARRWACPAGVTCAVPSAGAIVVRQACTVAARSHAVDPPRLVARRMCDYLGRARRSARVVDWVRARGI
jgi:hypothetical protein